MLTMLTKPLNTKMMMMAVMMILFVYSVICPKTKTQVLNKELRVPPEVMLSILEKTKFETVRHLVQKKASSSPSSLLSPWAKEVADQKIYEALIQCITENPANGFDDFVKSVVFKKGLVRWYSLNHPFQFNLKEPLNPEELLERIHKMFKKSDWRVASLVSEHVQFPTYALYSACQSSEAVSALNTPFWMSSMEISFYEPDFEVPKENNFKIHRKLVRACPSLYNQIRFTSVFELNRVFRYAASVLSEFDNTSRTSLSPVNKAMRERLKLSIFNIAKSPLFVNAFQDTKMVNKYLLQEGIANHDPEWLVHFTDSIELLEVKPLALLSSKFIFENGAKLYRRSHMKFTFHDLWTLLLNSSDTTKKFILDFKQKYPELWDVQNHEIDSFVNQLTLLRYPKSDRKFLIDLKSPLPPSSSPTITITT